MLHISPPDKRRKFDVAFKAEQVGISETLMPTCWRRAEAKAAAGSAAKA
ncbi:hypothetical protein [Hymenobacter sediminis]|nr:hypothetical protein [Hymenobacter sediminis]